MEISLNLDEKEIKLIVFEYLRNHLEIEARKSEDSDFVNVTVYLNNPKSGKRQIIN